MAQTISGEQIVQLMHVWARNCVGKYRIAQQCRKAASEIDVTAHPLLLDTWRTLMNTADALEAEPH